MLPCLVVPCPALRSLPAVLFFPYGVVLVCFVLFLINKKPILLHYWVLASSLYPTLTQPMAWVLFFVPKVEVTNNWNCLVANILQIILFYVPQKNNNIIHVWNDMRICHINFWVNYPFKRAMCITQSGKCTYAPVVSIIHHNILRVWIFSTHEYFMKILAALWDIM